MMSDNGKLQRVSSPSLWKSPDVWSSIIGAVSGLGQGLTNYFSVKQTNEQNERLQREEWAREDSEMQRGLADATKAGFSPVSVLAKNWTSGLSAQLTPPQLDLSQAASAVQSGVNSYLSRKQAVAIANAQISNIEQDIRTKSLNNQYLEAELKDKATSRILELVKNRKDLDLTEAQYYSLLGSIASQYGDNGDALAHELISHRSDRSDYRADNITAREGMKFFDSSADARDALAKAQTKLTDAQRSTHWSDSEQHRLLEQSQTTLNTYAAVAKKYDNDWWYTPLTKEQIGSDRLQYPVIQGDDIVFKDIPLIGKTRAEVEEYYNKRIREFQNQLIQLEKSGGTKTDKFYRAWEHVNSTVSAASGFLMPKFLGRPE